MKLNIGYVGLSHLGINSAIAASMRGFSVICFDRDFNLISSLKKKKKFLFMKKNAFNLKKKLIILNLPTI